VDVSWRSCSSTTPEHADWLVPNRSGLGVRDDRRLRDLRAETSARRSARGVEGRMNRWARASARQARKIPILVVGRRRRKATLGVNARGSNDPNVREVAEFRARLLEEIATHGSPEDVSGPRAVRRRGAGLVANVAQGHASEDGACVFCELAEEPVDESTGHRQERVELRGLERLSYGSDTSWSCRSVTSPRCRTFPRPSTRTISGCCAEASCPRAAYSPRHERRMNLASRRAEFQAFTRSRAARWIGTRIHDHHWRNACVTRIAPIDVAKVHGNFERT